VEIIDLTNFPEDSYIVIEQTGNCKICGKYDDLRYGSCFSCSDFVKSDGKKAWDVRNPMNKWNIQLN